ncbi:MAG: DsbA family oxidoreductase [bacterium]
MVNIVIYADFASPACYLASRRVDALIAAGIEVEWRAVEWDPRIPATGSSLVGGELETEVRRLSRLLLPSETLPWSGPRIVPNTQAAISGYAEAHRAGVGDDVRRLLYSAYWVDGIDIGSPKELWPRLSGPIMRGHSESWPLRESGYAIAMSGGPVTTGAWRCINAWREEWAGLGTREVPALVAGAGSAVTGETALRWLEKELIRHHAMTDPQLPEPSRYPPVVVRPHQTWVSQVGGTWANAWKAGS